MFSGATHGVQRFSLLLLEEGETYVQDYVASARWPHGVGGNWQRLPHLPGTLRLCTKSLFFEPDDARVPIVRLPFASIEGLEGSGDRRLVLTASRLVKMRANAADAPYVVEKAGQQAPRSGGGGGAPAGSAAQQQPLQAAQQAQHGHLFHWEFDLAYASLEGVMPLAQQMMVASRLPPGEQEEFLQATLAAAEAGARFDLGLLRSAGERVVAELPCALLSQGALVREPGRLLITDQRLYFQPLHSISGGAPVSSHPLPGVAAAARRRSSLRDLALEVFFSEPAEKLQHLAPLPAWGGASALFAFASREEREQALAALAAQPALGAALPGGHEAAAACAAILEADPGWLSRVTAAWQRGRLSNLDYLLFLNLASGRSFSDLSQYPVFPWVLADYSSPTLDLGDPAAFRDLSRPVGALNPRRLGMLRERFREMASFSPEPPFLYGSHYSTPGFTMFWLVRAAPAHMLRLQNGRFDAPDRLFCSIKDAWEGVTSSNPADVKELIPEFFLRHDFLLNSRSLALGTRQNGRSVGDVELPPWAAGAAHFRAMLQAALEAPFVSANLHHWIDLIFGCKQRGEAAVQADNVFRHTAYEGAVDIEAVADRTERVALEMQIQEFGQCPRQLFKHKHPQRLVCPPPQLPTPAEAEAAASDGGGSTHALPLALVSSILAAAAQGHGESPRLEVPVLLAQLDVLAARRQLEREQERRREGAAAVEAGEADGPALTSGGSGSSAADGPVSPSEGAQLAGGGGSSSRLRSLGAWAAERKQAVGEQLAGSVDAVRNALAGPQGSGGSASRLQSLFSRKGSASSSAGLDAAAGAAAASAAGAAPDMPPAAASGQQPARPAPQSPAARMAAGLVGSLGGRLSSLALRGGQQLDPTSSRAADQASAVSQPASIAAGGQTQQQAAPPQAAQQAPLQAGQHQPNASAAAGLGSASQGPMWKFSRQPVAAAAAVGQARAAGDSSEDEAAGHELRAQQHSTAPSSPGQQPGQAGSPASRLLEAQRQRMLTRGSPGNPGAAAAAGSIAPAALAGGPDSAPASPAGQAWGRRHGAERPGWYGPGLRDRLHLVRTLAAGSEPVNGCAVAAAAAGASGPGGELFLYSASHSGAVRVHSLSSGEQVRAAGLSEQPLTSVALLPLGGDAGARRHPLLLCGSYDACIHAYSPDYGSQQGSFQAAGDAVACLRLLGGLPGGDAGRVSLASSSARLLAGSWDGVVKVWELAEGRQPWSAGLAQPLAELAAPSSVWAVAASDEGQLVLAGTEDGLVLAWDTRRPHSQPLWQLRLVADNYVAGLELCPSSSGSSMAVAAAADGTLSLLDLRRVPGSSGSGRATVVAVACPSGMPLRCVATDGCLALAGDEGGALHMWDVAAQVGEVSPAALAPGAWTPPQPDGLLPPLAAAPPSAVTALAAAPGQTAGQVVLVTAHEAGMLRCFSTATST